MQAKLTVNPEGTQYEVDIPNVGTWDGDYPSEGLIVLEGDQGEDDYLLVVSQDGLDDQQVYKLVPIDTDVEEAELDEVDEDEEEEDEDDKDGDVAAPAL